MKFKGYIDSVRYAVYENKNVVCSTMPRLRKVHGSSLLHTIYRKHA